MVKVKKIQRPDVGMCLQVSLLKSKMKQCDLAKKMKVEPSYISNIAQNKKTPSFDRLTLIAENVGYDIVEFLQLGMPEKK